jgi:hypothetical protein
MFVRLVKSCLPKTANFFLKKSSVCGFLLNSLNCAENHEFGIVKTYKHIKFPMFRLYDITTTRYCHPKFIYDLFLSISYLWFHDTIPCMSGCVLFYLAFSLNNNDQFHHTCDIWYRIVSSVTEEQWALRHILCRGPFCHTSLVTKRTVRVPRRQWRNATAGGPPSIGHCWPPT